MASTLKNDSKRGSWKSFVPKSVVCWKEGYTAAQISTDIAAGVTVGVIALPLALAFAIGAGVSPDRGLFTAIIAGFLISALGGSRVQIGGPTGAFVVIIFDIIQKHGYEGLVVATLMAGVILILMGLLRFGGLLRFIPYPVITGFTTGIALTIFTSQLKDLLGLQIEAMPADFLGKWSSYVDTLGSFSEVTILLSAFTIGIILFCRMRIPKIPGAMIAVVLLTLIVSLFHLPVETVFSKFGEIPRMLPSPSFPPISLEQVRKLMPEAITIAFLAAIESLLSAVVADGMTGMRHKPNCELVAQGIANMGSVVFGGIPATGAIARTATNVRMGAKTPLAGITHAVTLFLILIAFAPFASLIPLCVLAAVLVVVSWHMAELDHFFAILRTTKGDAAILLTTFLLTVLVDLTVAVEVGVLLAALLFMKKMSRAVTLRISRKLVEEPLEESPEISDPEATYKRDIPQGVGVFEIEGPLFFGAADLLREEMSNYNGTDRVFILRMRKVLFIDATGINSIKDFHEKCRKKGILLLLSGVGGQVAVSLKRAGVDRLIGTGHIFSNIDNALACSRQLLSENPVG